MEQEQIEEMRKTIKQGFQKADCRVPYTNEPYPYFDSQINYIAKSLYNAGYRKLPDGAVILTPEERDEEMKEINKTLAERDELKAEIERLKEVIADQNELCWNCNKSVKEFAEKLRKKVISLNVWEFGEIDVIDVDDIDELLKEYEK